MKIVADENMPLVKELFTSFGEVQTFPGRELGPEQVKNADVLLVRSVTMVNAGLLEGSPVRFVGSATIGTDHVDLIYLKQQGIQFANAPGCNANAVVQYVLSVLFRLRPDWQEQTVGIVGCGNVGGRLYQTLQKLGVNCRCYDPFLSHADNAHLTSFEEVLQSDILCLHTPLTTEGPFPTFHLFDEAVLSQLASDTLLINAARGAVVDNQALLNTLLSVLPQRSLQVALDVWEGEPDILLPLLEQVDIGTPHIAGYSYDGKVNGTTMVRDAFCGWLGEAIPSSTFNSLSMSDLNVSSLSEAVLTTFDVEKEDQRMRDTLLIDGLDIPRTFDLLRKNCPKRLEFHHYRVPVNNVPSNNISKNVEATVARSMAALGFRVDGT